MAKKDREAEVEAATAAPSTGKKRATSAGAASKSADGSAAPLGNKDYEKALKKLHVELVKLQEGVVHKGLKVCIVFEGRDGAGKGGTIKALTERVSPRVFRVVALPAPTEREKPKLPKRQDPGGYREPKYPYKVIPSVY